MDWDVDQIVEWLKAIGFEKYTETFKNKSIDANTLIALRLDKIPQLLLLIDDDGTIEKPKLKLIQKFIKYLSQLKVLYEEIQRRCTLKCSKVQCLGTNEKQQSLNPNGLTLEVSQLTISSMCHYKYIINHHIHCQFFENPKFIPYLIKYIRENSFPIEIQIGNIQSVNGNESTYFSIEFSALKEQAELVCNSIEHLFGKIKSKMYHQNKIKTWLLNPVALSLIQRIMDNENDLFTVCKTVGNQNKTLHIHCFNHKTSHNFESTIRIEQIIQTKLMRYVFVLQFRQHQYKKLENGKLRCRNNDRFVKENALYLQFQNELTETIQNCHEKNQPISIVHRRIPLKFTSVRQEHIQLFGYSDSVYNTMKIIQDLLNKYMLTKHTLNEIAPEQIEYLEDFHRKELNEIESLFRYNRLQIRTKEKAFYSSLILKDEIYSSINNLLSHLTNNTFITQELYFDIPLKVKALLKIIARNNRCHINFQIETKLISMEIPHSNSFVVSTTNILFSSPLFSRQIIFSNVSIELFIGDITTQNVDAIVIPSFSNGFKEFFLGRAGQITRQRSENLINDCQPKVLEVIASKLGCKMILFVDWSLSKSIVIDQQEKNLRESVRTFIIRVFQYISMKMKQPEIKIESIAFAIPDVRHYENILAEEMIYETQRQVQLMKSIPLKILFVLLPDQKSLHKEFCSTISTMQINQNKYGTLSCPVSTFRITLTASNNEQILKCEEKINNFLRRYINEIELEGFNNWDQSSINAFYKYCYDRRVVVQIDQAQNIVLKGFIGDLFEVKQKYQQTVQFNKYNLDLHKSFPDPCISHNIMLSFSHKDLYLIQNLAHRLDDEGFSVYFNTDEIIDRKHHSACMDKANCIILCISQNYFEDENCQKEFQYANEIRKKQIPVKIQLCDSSHWMQKVFSENSYFHLFGSDSHIDLVFNKLVIELLCIISPNVPHFRAKHNFQATTTSDGYFVNALSPKYFQTNNSSDTSRNNLKMEVSSKQIAYTVPCTDLFVQSCPGESKRSGWIFEDVKSARKSHRPHCKISTSIKRPTKHRRVSWQTIRLILYGIATDEQISQRQNMIDTNKMITRRKEIGNYFMQKYPNLNKKNMKLHLEFGQKMIENANQLNELCQLDVDLLREDSLKNVQQSFKAIFFSLNPFPVNEITSSGSKIDHPLNQINERSLHNMAFTFKMVI